LAPRAPLRADQPQLYAQLQAADWTDPQLGLVARAYALAIDVCGCSFRPNGKPFLCHLVGTASIVASWNGPIDEVVCGLVHAVYSHGVCSGDRERGMTDQKRAIVSEAIGDVRGARRRIHTVALEG
jgi:(p)ppGpp synthase/HD superfamily hydrolase